MQHIVNDDHDGALHFIGEDYERLGERDLFSIPIRSSEKFMRPILSLAMLRPVLCSAQIQRSRARARSISVLNQPVCQFAAII